MPIEIISVNQLLQTDFPPSDSLVGDGLIDKGGAILVTGPQKIGEVAVCHAACPFPGQ